MIPAQDIFRYAAWFAVGLAVAVAFWLVWLWYV